MMRVDPVGQPGAALVEQDEPRERAQPRHEMGEAGIFPMHFEVGDVARHEHEIDLAVADDLIGNPNVAALRVTRLRRRHGRTLRRSTQEWHRFAVMSWRLAGAMC